MKKTLSLIAIFFLFSCAKDLTAPREAQIETKTGKSILVYIDSELEKKYVFSSKSGTIGFALSDLKNSGVKTQEWSQNIGALSANQFRNALKQGFAKVEFTNKKPVKKNFGNYDYLIIPTIEKAEVVIRDYLQSYVVITYKILAFDNKGNEVANIEKKVKENGKYKSADMTSVMGVPVAGKINKPNDSMMIFKAIAEGVDESVNALIKSIEPKSKN